MMEKKGRILVGFDEEHKENVENESNNARKCCAVASKFT